MTTYTLAIEHFAGGPWETKAYSTATNAIDELEDLRAAGAVVSVILRDGQPIDEAALRADEEVRVTITAE